MGISIMRMITATTAFKMPFSGICLSQSTVSKILTEASLYPTEIFPVINSKNFKYLSFFVVLIAIGMVLIAQNT